jgi:hypothetical protein
MARLIEDAPFLIAWRLFKRGRDAHDARVEAEQKAADEARIAALPRVNCWGRPVSG